MPMMASISRISAGLGLSCGLSVWCGLALHIRRRGQTHCHDQEEGPHRGGEIQRGKEKRRRRRGRLPTSREALKLTGELGDAWHLYAVTGCTTSCVQKPRARAAETLFFFHKLTPQSHAIFHKRQTLLADLRSSVATLRPSCFCVLSLQPERVFQHLER